ncbi:multidrug effflux MFS transporter [Legionella shakespearei]|uniref:Bcr/CflA family efflux transporter n=1 Tax=Legionella shakespearei DSM 23087 TaxID=1122169 RepID=A0A0W0ZED8_9GAMM|nr:multidrug effflux MFS transporter [Legionella shakespearei]KTD67565.1 multidrug resistance protein [Legionella shakespearei DSM 23087]
MNNGMKKNAINHNIALLAIILLISSLGQVTSDLYLPSLPSMAKSLSVDINWIQFTIAIFMAGFSISQLVYGPWSDAIGRRSPLLIGLSINLIGSLICWLSPNIYLLFLGRFIQGLGVGAGYSLARPMLRDLFEKETLAIYNSYLAVSTVVILTTAPILGGYIQQYAGWRYNFLFLSIYGFLILYFFYHKTPETSRFHHKDNLKIKIILTNTKILIKSPIFLRFSLCPLLTYAGILAWITAAPIVLQEKVGLNPVQFGWIYIFSGIGFAAGGFLNMRFVTRLGIDRMMNIGFLCQLCAGLIMLSFYLLGYINTYVIVAPILLFMMGSSLVFPNSSAGALTPFPKIAGTAGALFGFVQILGGAISSSIVALSHDKNQLPIAIAFIITALLSILSFRTLKSKI